MNTTENKEVCEIRIMFVVESDNQAIEIKKKITTVISDLPDAQVRFTLMPVPVKGELHG